MKEQRNESGHGDFRAVDANELSNVTVCLQALDNQWFPEPQLNEIVHQRNGVVDDGVLAKRKTLVKREFWRALVNAKQMVVNRAHLLNNDMVAELYEGKGNSNISQLKELLTDGTIVPYLYDESSPYVKPNFDIPDGRMEKWQNIARESNPHCLRLSWNDEETNRKQADRLLRKKFVDFGLTLMSSDPLDLARLADNLKIPKPQQNGFAGYADDTVSTWFVAHKKDATRNNFYKEFITPADTNVADCHIDPKKPFAKELKLLFDLKYNVNFSDAIGRFTMTAADSPQRTVLGENHGGQPHANAVQDAEQLRTITQNLVTGEIFDLQQIHLDSLSLADVVEIRKSDEFFRYINSFQHLIGRITTASIEDLEKCNYRDDMLNVFGLYKKMLQAFQDRRDQKKQHTRQDTGKLVSGFTLVLAGVTIASLVPDAVTRALAQGAVSVTTTILSLNALKELRSKLVAGHTYPLVYKFFCKNSNGSNDTFELQHEIRKLDLNNAQEQIDLFLESLKKDFVNFEEKNHIEDTEATINDKVE